MPSKKHSYSALRIVFIFAIAIMIYSATIYYRAYQRAEDALEYSLLSLQEITLNWDAAVLRKRLSNVSDMNEKNDLQEIADAGRTEFGRAPSLKPTRKCEIYRGVHPRTNDEHTFADCEFEGEFRKGSATTRLNLIYEDGAWKIENLIAMEYTKTN